MRKVSFISWALAGGLLLTAVTMLSSSEITPVPDGYPSYAHVYGLPMRYYFTVQQDEFTATMRAEVACDLALSCDFGHQDTSPLVAGPFLVDVAFWSGLSALSLLIYRGTRSVWLRRRSLGLRQ